MVASGQHRWAQASSVFLVVPSDLPVVKPPHSSPVCCLQPLAHGCLWGRALGEVCVHQTISVHGHVYETCPCGIPHNFALLGSNQSSSWKEVKKGDSLKI